MRDSLGRVGVDPARFCSKSGQACHPDWDWMFTVGYLNSYFFLGGSRCGRHPFPITKPNGDMVGMGTRFEASSRSYVLGGHVTVGSSGIPAWLGSNAPGLGAPWPERALA
jgi:hypothetical protein